MEEIYTVGAVNQYIRNLFESDDTLVRISVRGEVSNCKYHSSGHIYFTLKDAVSSLSCVMFASQRKGLSFRLSEGQQVVVYGNISVYERDGRYQLYARRIRQDGEGNLYQQYEELKKKLERQGYFDPAHKEKIPAYPKQIGIVTAATGAAIQDIVNITKRRDPYVQLILYPAKVQGEGAAETIVEGIRELDAYGVDTIIVGRGGGSIEDLWAFNEESVAQAIYDCRTPIISAVGHETDVTISDFVADLRAPTPSAAAELAVPDVRALFEKMKEYEEDLNRLFEGQIRLYRQYVAQYQLKLSSLSPQNQFEQLRMRLLDYERKLEGQMEKVLTRRKHERDLYGQRLEGCSPLAKLSGGWAYVTDQQGKFLHGIKDVECGQILKISLADGDLQAEVKEIEEKER